MQRIVAFMAIALIATACAFPQQGTDTPDEIGGTYYVNGTDALGIEYGGQLIITRDGSDYALQWIITGVVQVGTGDFDGVTLEAEWETIEPENGLTGTASYELQPDGSLIGERTTDGVEGAGYEEAFPVRE